ncbi:MAG: YafY family transcriptional regulator [Hoeflea sp.]|uniref:helix-turn-helix transcriptional regulator n=1 Tax=Hoeflea sp. TaxID=1940281 RepID=UPI001DCAF9CE|nr:YafY family protein [Hoeflea sp.]MBU4531867.1 YafY family transcriptional regulator [Alphaproteobacteria bacterium]MBU4544723.1 YafY family transcriptional regulator [Alphaproteobacteria bacterium]MBU4552954.1 YafY family transcriptional regulator [Alphaproteobacteria bacterium]MBV1725143.1 YafY family transcriptional regulator [Hoeflea sp.]MBV1761163.1 YafY family transcriptional regulator [Hoeflea sp.]
MRRSNRLFEIIQILRAAGRPMTADALARKLEVSTRTIYRDIAALQMMRTPIEGEPGIGYVMRRGYDLPPLNFDPEEIEALRVGLALLSRTGDSALQRAARRIHEKVEALHGPADWLLVAPWGAPPDDPAKGCVQVSTLRDAIRAERKLRLTYQDEQGCQTVRTVRPLALVYHLECVMLACWCELRAGFRHFRTDRIYGCDVLAERFVGQGEALRGVSPDQNRWDPVAPDLAETV